MKKNIKKFGIFLFSVAALLYISFLFILPFAVQPLKYKADIQSAVKNSCGLDFDFENAKIITTPLLGIGIKIHNLDLSVPENKNIFKTEDITFRMSLPSLLFKTLKITYADINNPTVNIDINEQGTQYEIVDFLSKNSQVTEENKPEEIKEEQPSDITNDFKFKVNKFTIKNYALNINDNKNKHKLSLNGNNLYLKFDGKNLHVKTNPVLKYDEQENITANIDIKTYLPDFAQVNNNNTTQEETGFINPVEMFGKYNLKSAIQTKLTVSKEQDKNKITGNLYVTDTTVNISGIQIPENFIKLDFGGYNVNINSSLCLSEKEKAEILGSVNFGDNFKTDLAVKTDKIYLSNLLKLTQAILDSLSIENPLNTISVNGYLKSDMKIKTDLKDIKSSGNVTIADGYIKDSASGLVISNMKANIILDNNNVNIKDTEASVNGTPFIASGTVNEKSEADIKIYTKNLPLEKLYSTFAPADLKRSYSVTNGILSLDILLSGNLNKIEPIIKSEIVNLKVRDKVNDLDITNGICNINIDTDLKSYNGSVSNKNLVINAPALSSTIRNAGANIDFTEKDITLKSTDIVINGVSTVNIAGDIKNYTQKPEIAFIGNGSIRSADIKNFAGKDMAPFIKSSGIIPVKFFVSGNDKTQNVIFRAYGSENEYVTPIDISEILGKQSTIQLVAEIANNKVTFKDTGIYSGSYSDIKSEIKSNPIATVTGSLNLDKNMTLNNIKIATNGNKKVSVCALKNSSLNANADITVSGTSVKPVLRGNIKADNMNIPQLKTKLKNADIALKGDTFDFNLQELNLNGTTLNIDGKGLLDFNPITTISNITIQSDDFNSDKAMKVTEYMANVPALNSNPGASMPVKITSGTVNMKKLSSGDIVAENLIGDLTLLNDVVYVKNIRANAFDGTFNGDVSMNLLTTEVKAAVSGAGMNADKTVTACAAMKNTIFGTLGFNADISLKGADYIEQMKTLNGKADFNISQGQFGTLGKFETFMKADNLASIAFISTKIGSVVNKISPHNTAEFSRLNGNVTFKNGIMVINPITSSGKNMSMYITGLMNLVNNNADLLILGKVSEEVTSILGPLEQLNPTRMLKNSTATWATLTVGILNAINEKSTPAEINKIPSLTPAPATDNSSKFIVKINGNIEKPQSAVKSFKWLSPEEDLTKAQNALSPKEVVENAVKAIPKSKEEAIETLKEAGKNTLLNIGKQLLNPDTSSETKEEKSSDTATEKQE